MMTRSMTRIAELEKENEKLKFIIYLNKQLRMITRSTSYIAELEKQNKKLKKENKIHLQRYDELLREEYPTCVECQDEKCIDFDDRLCHSCFHKDCKLNGDECWCACLDSDDPLKIEDSEDGDSDDDE